MLKRVLLPALAAVALLAIVPVAWTQCSGGNCTVQTFPTQYVGQAPYRWVRRADTADEVYLYQGGRQVGGYSFTTGFYRPYNNGNWGAHAVAPVRPPFGDLPVTKEGNFFGVESKQFPDYDKVWQGNTIYSHAEAKRLMGETMDDISKQPHLTIVDGDASRRKKIVADFEAAKEANTFPKAVRVQVYDTAKNAPRLLMAPFQLERDERFRKSGVAMFAQAPAGKDGTAKVESVYGVATPAAAVELLRKIDPRYDPNKQPTPSIPWFTEWTAEAWGMAVLCALVVLGLIRRAAS